MSLRLDSFLASVLFVLGGEVSLAFAVEWEAPEGGDIFDNVSKPTVPSN